MQISLLKVFDNAEHGVISKIVLIILMNVSYFLCRLLCEKLPLVWRMLLGRL